MKKATNHTTTRYIVVYGNAPQHVYPVSAQATAANLRALLRGVRLTTGMEAAVVDGEPASGASVEALRAAIGRDACAIGSEIRLDGE